MANPKSHKVFVYGILKDRFPIIEKEDTIDGTMVDLGPFPVVLALDTGHTVTGQVIDVTPAILKRMDQVEGVSFNHYERKKVKTAAGHTCFVYVYHSSNYPKLITQWSET